MKLLHRQTPAMAVTHVMLILPQRGCSLDPAQRRGLSRLMLRMLFMGADGLGNAEYNARLERLGAHAGSSLSNDTWSLRLTTLTEHLDEALALFMSAITGPNLDGEEFNRLQQELLSGWLAEREESKRLKAREVYVQNLYRHGATGYQPDGTQDGLKSSTRDDVTAHFAKLRGNAEPVLAVLSDLNQAEVETRIVPVLQTFAASSSPSNGGYPWDTFSPPPVQGREVTIVEEADTNTDEVIMGAFSTHPLNPDWHLHRMVSFIFGGDMNSRLFRIIRGERGLSYGASCWYEAATGNLPRDRPGPFSLYTFPSSDKSAEAIPLILKLYEELIVDGVTDAEMDLARSALVNSYPFRWDTPQKQLSLDVEAELYGYHLDDAETHQKKLEEATREDIHKVLQQHHHPQQLQMVFLGDTGRLRDIAESLPNVEKIETICYP